MYSTSIIPFLSLATLALAGLEDAKYSTVLGADNFDASIASKSEGSLVAFFAPWCGHCKSLEPAWTVAAKAYEGSDRCQIAHLNADAAENKPLGQRFGVKGFPTLKWVKPDGTSEDYQGGRTAEAISAYMEEKCGVSDTAGRIPALDKLASAYFAPTAERSSLLASASTLAASLAPTGLASYYVKLMTKFVENAEDAQAWFVKEGDRLGKLAGAKGAVAGKKLDEFKMKQNILKAFAYVKATGEEAAAAIVEKVEEIKDEL